MRQATWDYAEFWAGEDEVLIEARTRAEELGCHPVPPGAASALRTLAAAIDARNVVEIGTGTGVSGVSLLRGMRPDGVLTTVDVEAEHQRAARVAFTAAGFAPNRARVIAGRAAEVLPRLTDGVYDMVFCDGDPADYAEFLTQAMRLLRPGGVVAFEGALWHEKVPDPAQRDADTVAVRQLAAAIRDDDRLVSTLLPVGDGLLVAVKRASGAIGP